MVSLGRLVVSIGLLVVTKGLTSKSKLKSSLIMLGRGAKSCGLLGTS